MTESLGHERYGVAVEVEVRRSRIIAAPMREIDALSISALSASVGCAVDDGGAETADDE